MRLFKRKHRHQWVKVHEAVWDRSGGYAQCACGTRDTFGADAYGPYSWPWVKDGALPPATFLEHLDRQRERDHKRKASR